MVVAGNSPHGEAPAADTVTGTVSARAPMMTITRDVPVASVGANDRDGIRVLSSAPGTAAAGDAAVYTSAGTTINVSNEFGDGIIARSSDQYDFSASGRGAGSVTVAPASGPAICILPVKWFRPVAPTSSAPAA